MSDSLFAKVSFGTATALTGYLQWRCMRPPNAPDFSVQSTIRDSMAGTKHFFSFMWVCRNMFFAATIWQGLFCASARAAPAIRPGFPANKDYLTWNYFSASSFIIIWTCALVRLRAMGELGSNFTFELREPGKLETGGIYRYVQHPSYSSGLVVFIGCAFWFVRCDGVMSTVLPVWILKSQWLWNWFNPSVVSLTILYGFSVRVLEEEAMLRKTFGKEWEVWHQQTARFIPFVF